MCSAEVSEISHQSMSACTELGGLLLVQEPQLLEAQGRLLHTLPWGTSVQNTSSCSAFSSVVSNILLSVRQAIQWGVLQHFDINKRLASYIAHTTMEVLRYREKEVNSERFYVLFAWLETLCFCTSSGSEGRNTLFSFQHETDVY